MTGEKGSGVVVEQHSSGWGGTSARVLGPRLGPFWAERLGKTQLTALQASDRGGVLRVEVRPNARLTVSGRAKVRTSP